MFCDVLLMVSFKKSNTHVFGCNSPIPALEIPAVFMDISKAFDKVWHDGLIFKLEQNGVSGALLSLLKDYLSKRIQHIVLKGSAADYDDVKSGVPQGSFFRSTVIHVKYNHSPCRQLA